MEGRGGADYWKDTQKVGGYRGNTFIKPPAGGDGGLRGGGEGRRGEPPAGCR